jgi:hypothetical protein
MVSRGTLWQLEFSRACLSRLLTAATDKRIFVSIRSSVAESFATPSMRFMPLEAPTSRRSQGTRVGHTNSFRRRITRLDRSRSSASTQRHLTSATEHERALTKRELALRAVAAVGADRHLPELPTTEAPRAGSSSGEPVLSCRGRMARRGHHLAPRPALGCATGAATNRAGGR